MTIADRLIRRAKRTPYYHLGNYMERYWLVPYNRTIIHEDGQTHGTGRVPWLKRPVARLLQTFGIAVRVHRILRSDYGRDFHDHPWNFLSVILKGGYNEATPADPHGAWYGAGSVLFRRATDWHRLVLPWTGEAWTLFISGPRIQRWGFLVDGKKVPYTEYKGVSE